jgi:hypothetical protein
MATNVRSGTAQVTIGGSIPIDQSDGAAHLFVDPVTGSDESVGLTPDSAFQTINKAVERMNEWLLLELDVDLVIELANGTYAEDVQFLLESIPQRRVIVRGDPDLMTVIAEAAVTAGTAQLVTAAALALVANDHVGRIVEVFDPASPATTRQFKTIRSNTATTISPVGPFSPVPVAGWTVRVKTPAVNIVGQGTGSFNQNAALDVICPWDTAFNGNVEFEGGGPMIGFMFIRATAFAASSAIRQTGGSVKWTGVVVDGAGEGFHQFSGAALVYGAFPGIVDLIYGTTATYSPNIDACLGVRSTVFGLRCDQGSWIIGSLAMFLVPIELFGARAQLFGGSLVNQAPVGTSRLIANEMSDLSIVGGGINAADPLLPMLMRNLLGGAVAFDIRERSRAEIQDVVFDGCAGDGFQANSGAIIDLRATIGPAAVELTGIGVHGINGGCIFIAAAVTFGTGGTNIRVGNGATANGDSTFAALTPTAPIYDRSDDNGRGVADVRPGSMSAVWEV